MSDSLKAAALAAAKVNAILYAKGKLKLPETQKVNHATIDRPIDSLITREYEINDVPAPARNLLTRGFVQDEICKYSGASISTRGRFLSYEEKLNLNTKDRPLYLHIQGSSKESVNLAMVRIQEMIGQFDKSFKPDPSFTPPTASFSSGGHFVQDKVFVGLESNSPAFSVREKLLGPGGSYLQHIKTEIGAQVTLRGRGSGYIEPTSGREAFEPLYIYLTHPKPEGLQAARTLALNLIDTVHTEYSLFQQQQGQQAMMPVTISQHLPFQSQVPVMQAVVCNSLNPTIPPGIYTCSANPSYGFQPTFVNNVADMSTMPVHPSPPVNSIISVPTVHTLPLNSINGPTMSLATVDTMTMNSVPSAIMNSINPMNNPAVSMALNSMVTVNPVTTMPLNTIPPTHVSSVPSMLHGPIISAPSFEHMKSVSSVSMLPVNVSTVPINSMLRDHMNPVSTMPLNSLPNNIPTSMAMNVMSPVLSTSVPLMPMQGNTITSMPQSTNNFAPPWVTSAVAERPMEPPMGIRAPYLPQPNIPMMQQPSGTFTDHPATQYVPVSLNQQSVLPTTYTHLYVKQQQQLGMPHGNSPVSYLQQGQKRKFREDPEPEHKSHQDQYSLQATLAGREEQNRSYQPRQEGTFRQPYPPSSPHVLWKREGQAWASRDRNLMPPPPNKVMPPPPISLPKKRKRLDNTKG